EISFIRPGCYRVKLTAYNNSNKVNTTKSVLKDDYICVVGYCTPRTTIQIQALSVSNVVLKDATGTAVIDNSSPDLAVNGYVDYSKTVTARMIFGEQYNLEISRLSTSEQWNGQAWIDWNID